MIEPKIYAKEYDDDDNAADIEDADKGDDDEQDRSGSQIRIPKKNMKGLYKEDIGTDS